METLKNAWYTNVHKNRLDLWITFQVDQRKFTKNNFFKTINTLGRESSFTNVISNTQFWYNTIRSFQHFSPICLLECSHLCQGWLCGLQVAGSSCLDLWRGFGAAVRIATVFFCHGLDIAATAHPPTWDLIILSQRWETAPVILRHLRRWGEIR